MNTQRATRNGEQSGHSGRSSGTGSVLVGSVLGIGIGAFAAGPAAALGGALIGAFMGGAIAWGVRESSRQQVEREHRLDDRIGVTSGSIGVPGLEHPPSKTGAFSKEASGAANSSDPTMSEGPFLPPPG